MSNAILPQMSICHCQGISYSNCGIVVRQREPKSAALSQEKKSDYFTNLR
ncbi:MAG: hypothetical protein DSM106950_06040 [Stigonema ocellatum SAG 48.90 = DSM 106950]|nr:hypothetical protein [Stigonema ocellatum SAG 48.90 = DSM 106950]